MKSGDIIIIKIFNQRSNFNEHNFIALGQKVGGAQIN
jgi:hypothetical protein